MYLLCTQSSYLTGLIIWSLGSLYMRLWMYKCIGFLMFLFINSCVKENCHYWFPFNIYQGYEHISITYFAKNLCKNINLFSRTREISDSLAAAVVIPTTKDTAAREKEDNKVKTEEELGIFQLLDRLEEVTSKLTNRWQESTLILVLSLLFYSLCSLYNYSLNMYFWNISFFKVKKILYHQLSC